MHTLTLFRRCTAWFAMWALCVGALLPTLGQAVAASWAAPDTVEVCTATGMVRLKAEASGAPQAADPVCVWATLQGGTGLEPMPVAVVLPRLALPFMPPAFYHAPETAGVWLTALSRGPPALS